MPLDPKDGIGSYIKDFKKSKAPQFKGKSEKKRRQMAIAAYLDAKRGPQEAKLMGNTLKLFGQSNRPKTFGELSMKLKAKAKIARGLRGPNRKAKPDWMRDTGKRAKEIAKRARGHIALAKRDDTRKELIKRALNRENTNFKVEIEGLPVMYMKAKTPGELKQQLRKIVKQPSLIKDVDRIEKAKVRKAFRQKAQGREVAEYKYDYGTPESVKLMKQITPGQKEGTDAPKGPESYEAQYKRRLVKTTDPEHKAKGFKYRIKGKKDSSLTKKLYKTKPGQAEFNKQMKRIAGHEFG
tara:strand:- start:1034 stop:1918 length:885 start_codon:yes stop_codon:yes gene_type:complete